MPGKSDTIEDLMALLCADNETCARVILARTHDAGIVEEVARILRNTRRARGILGKAWKKENRRKK